MSPRRRSTPYAVLGLLSLAPMSGYDIRREAFSSIGYFWSESFGQIYPALRDLASRGLIRRRPGRQGGRRDRLVYEITERGREALERWRVEPPRPGPIRNELLLKLFFGARRSVETEIGWMDQLQAQESLALHEFQKIRRRLQTEMRDHPSLPFWLMTLGYGEHRSRGVVRWCRETRKALRSLESGPSNKEPTMKGPAR